MFKSNGNNKLQFDRAGLINQMITIFIIVIGGLVVYFNTTGEMKTDVAVSTQRLSTVEDLCRSNARAIRGNAKAISDLTRTVDRGQTP